MVYVYNGIFAKINSYYSTITQWSIATNELQWLVSFCSNITPKCLILMYLTVNSVMNTLLIAY